MGQRAPDFTLYTADGQARTRDELLASGPVLLAVGYTLLLAWNRGERIEGEGGAEVASADITIDRSDAT